MLRSRIDKLENAAGVSAKELHLSHVWKDADGNFFNYDGDELTADDLSQLSLKGLVIVFRKGIMDSESYDRRQRARISASLEQLRAVESGESGEAPVSVEHDDETDTEKEQKEKNERSRARITAALEHANGEERMKAEDEPGESKKSKPKSALQAPQEPQSAEDELKNIINETSSPKPQSGYADLLNSGNTPTHRSRFWELRNLRNL